MRRALEGPEGMAGGASLSLHRAGIGYYLTGGGAFDGIILCELPDAATARAVHLLQTASGKFERMEGMQLFTAAEAERIAMTARSQQGAWLPPGHHGAA